MVEFITENEMFNYQAFSDILEVQLMAKESLDHVSKLYPIYVMMNYHNGEALTKEQENYLDVLIDLASYYEADITLVVNEQDAQLFREYDEDNVLKFIVHSCYDSHDELSNGLAKIKNLTLKSAASRFGNRNINWIFLIEEGVKFNRFNQNKYQECNKAQDILMVLSIWQYYTTKKAYTVLSDENQIGLTGIAEYEPNKSYQEFIIDKTLLTSALLINLSECNRKHIEFDLMYDVLEDIDFNVNMFASGLHVIGITWPLSITKQPIEYRTNRKLSNFAVNVWAKWGDRVVKKLIVDEHKIEPIFANDFSSIIAEYNSSNRHRIIWPKNELIWAEYLAQKKKFI